MDAVAESAARFCGASNAAIFRLEGESLRLVAAHGPTPSSVPIGGTIAASPRSFGGRVVHDRQTIHIEDILALPETEFPETLTRMWRSGVPFRTMLATPLLREGVPMGVIYLRRNEVQPFTEKQIALLKTFADQAVIAIENVRLFQELEARNRDLTEALERRRRAQIFSESSRPRLPICGPCSRRSSTGPCASAARRWERSPGTRAVSSQPLQSKGRPRWPRRRAPPTRDD